MPLPTLDMNECEILFNLVFRERIRLEKDGDYDPAFLVRHLATLRDLARKLDRVNSKFGILDRILEL